MSSQVISSRQCFCFDPLCPTKPCDTVACLLQVLGSEAEEEEEEEEDGDAAAAAAAAAVQSILGCAGDVLFCDWATALISRAR